jgi:hypothetical protein
MKIIKKRIKFIFIGGCLSAFLGFMIFLPGEVLMRQSRSEQNVICSVPEEQYQAARSMAAKEMSAKLSDREKKQLVEGTTKSEILPAEEDEMELTAYEAVKLAKVKLQTLYQKKKFPVNFTDSYQNWFCWRAEPYQAEDTVFHIYTVLFWQITFEKYDGSEAYSVKMLEDGTIVTT